MARLNLNKIHPFLLVPTLLVFSSVSVLLAQADESSPAHREPDAQKVAVARVWHGRTPVAKADEYYAYLTEAGIKKIKAVPGNLGVQVFRRTTGDVTEFTVISYWEALDAIRRFAGDDIEKTHHLPKDAEYLLELEPTVKHHEVVLNEWKR